ncbi:MAG: FtsX-like permease family protein [Acidimicrobiia bacterium]
MWRVTLKGLFAKKLRLVLTSISVVLGVAFMSGTFVLTDTLGSVFDDLFSQQATDIDAVVRAKLALSDDQQGFAPRNPVPEALVASVESVKGVAVAEGAVQGIATVVGRDGEQVVNGGAPPLGFNWPSKPFASLYHLQSGSPPDSPDEVAIDEKTAKAAGYKVGDQVPMIFLTTPPGTYTLSGIFKYGESGLAGATLSGFETDTAQTVMNRVDEFDEIDAKAKKGVSPEQLVTNIEKALRADGELKGFEVLTGDEVAKETADNIKQGLSFFNTFLLVFAFISLFVGAFIIYNTFSIIVAQRSRELALLRALGASAKQVTRSVTAEALLVGLLSSVIGLGLGVFVAVGLQALLSAFGFELPTTSPVILPRTIILALVVGTVVTYVSAIAPARRAAKVAPVAAMRDTPVVLGGGNRRYRIGGMLLAIGLLLLGLGLFAGIGSDSFPGGAAGIVGLAAALVFIGVAMVSPLIARPVSRVLGWLPARFRGMSGVLARENAMRNPRRTATTAAALMIGLALITLVAIIGASAKASFSSIIDDSVRSDFIVTPKTFFGGGFTPDVATQIRDELPDASVVEFRDGFFKLGTGKQEQLNGVPADVEDALRIDLQPGADLDAFADGGVLVYKDSAKDLGVNVGDEITMEFERTGARQVTVQGIYDEKRTAGVNYLLSLADYEQDYVDQVDTLVGVKVGQGESTEAARRSINGILKSFPSVKVEDQAEFKESRLAMFNTILNLLYVMLLLAVIIALIGIVNTLALSIYERTREIGLLRAVGMTRKQVKRMVRDEAVIISIFGSLLGLAIGLVFGAALVSAIGNEGVKFTLPVTQLVVFVLLAGLAGLLAGMWPARRAAGKDVLEAIEA